MSDEEIINSEKALYDHIEKLRTEFAEHKYLRVTVKTGKQRTLTQNRALHLYCEHLAQALNDGGFDFRATIKDGVEVPWSMELVKAYMWKPIQEAMTGHDSTTKPLTGQYGEIYEVLNRYTASKLGVSVLWPSKDSMGRGYVLEQE